MSSETRLSGPLFLIDSASANYTSEASTRSSADWLQPPFLQRSQDATLVRSLADSLLASISEITNSMASQEAEQETFIEIGCYFYRASMAITELKTTERTPPNAVEILRSLSESVGSAADLVNGLGKGSEPGMVVSKLGEVIRSVGERLISIPSSVYEDEEYAGVAIRTLSREMLSSGEKTEPIETDLYSVNMEDSPLPNALHVDTSAIGTSSRRSRVKYENEKSGSSLAMLPQLAQYMEPLFASFSCPLTKKVMDDPVTIETGATYERRAISEWFEKYIGNDDILCPSGNKLRSKAMNPNMALRSTIEEWKERNETARIKVARAALALASSESMVFEAVKDVLGICEKNLRRKAQVFGSGMLPLLSKTLQHPKLDVRCAVLELLILLAEDDDENKEMVAEDLDLGVLITLLSSDYQPERHASLALMLELSKVMSLCERIGSVPGAILTLIAVKYRSSTDAFACEKASEALKNLERSLNNIKRMAENGFFEPLLSSLSQGGEETKTEMASCLGENESTSHVAEAASPILIVMIRTGNSLSRRAAFKALSQISLQRSNAEALARAGTVQAMTEEIFTRTIHDELFDSKSEAALILANVFESGPAIVELECDAIRNLVHSLKSSGSDEPTSTSLVRILLCLAKIPRSMPVIVSAVEETDASLVLFDHMNSRDEFLAVAATKLLAELSAEIGDSLAERLCETRGQPESLVAEIARGSSEKRAASSAELLAKLPHHSLVLNLALLFNNAVPVVINAITRSRPGSRARPSLVGTLVRFTATLHDPAILSAARAHNFTALFTELLSSETSGEEVQRLSAVGLGNLSSESVGLKVWLSKPSSLPPPPAKKKQTVLARVFSSRSKRGSPSPATPIFQCPVHHGGECSGAATFCLVEAGAVEPLMSCLESESNEVVGAALSALSTLLDDGVDVEGGARMLSWRFDAVRRVARVVRDIRDEGVRRKSLWVVERLLERGGGDVAGDDRSLAASLVGAFRDGDAGTSQMAENILRRLNKMPSSAANYYST